MPRSENTWRIAAAFEQSNARGLSLMRRLNRSFGPSFYPLGANELCFFCATAPFLLMDCCRPVQICERQRGVCGSAFVAAAGMKNTLHTRSLFFFFSLSLSFLESSLTDCSGELRHLQKPTTILWVSLRRRHVRRCFYSGIPFLVSSSHHSRVG
jgi:hypothetical protein